VPDYYGLAFNKDNEKGWILGQGRGMDFSVVWDPEKKGYGNLCWIQFVADKDNDPWDTGYLTIDGNGRLGVGAEPSYWMFDLDPVKTPTVMRFADKNHKAYKMEVSPEVVGQIKYFHLEPHSDLQIRKFDKMKKMPDVNRRSLVGFGNELIYDPNSKYFVPEGCDEGQDLRELEEMYEEEIRRVNEN